ncbi:hypothetical protein [Ideonella sp. YS5]|uniref:hypothetical protein n=1 Tax=Ideonella sp. YS5 TaxID=3453714 RepID=UPI003EEFE0BA
MTHRTHATLPVDASYDMNSLPEEMVSIDNWPPFETSVLSDTVKERFERFEKAIRGFFAHRNAGKAAKEAGVHRNTFLDVVKRCLRLDDQGGIVGWLGLVKNLQLKRRRGQLGTFFAEHPQIQEDLNEFILPRNQDGAPRATRRQKSRVFAKFKELCTAEGIKNGQYPFTSKSCGRRSIERYVDDHLAENANQAVRHWFGHAAAKRMGLQTGLKSFDFALTPLAFAMIDAHKQDCIGTIDIPGPAGLQPVAIERLWLVPDFDANSRAVFGYSVGIRSEVSASEIEEAIRFSTKPWTPRTLTIPGLAYDEQAGFPCSVIEGLTERRPAAYMLDNAAAHYAERIIEGVRRATGAAVTFGAIGEWWFNAVIERFFKTVENFGFQLLTSSVGNQPKDPLKPKDSVGNAIRHRVTVDHLLEIADVLFANYNATPTAALGHRSPLQALKDSIACGDVVPRVALPPTALTPALGIARESKPVRGNLDKGRRPYVQIDKERYSSPEFSSRFDLVGVRIVVHIDEEDMRAVEAFDPQGLPLGQLVALGQYRHTKHSRAMRKIINGLYKAGVVHCDFGGDLVDAYHNHLIQRSVEQAEKAPNKINRPATKLAHSAQKTGLPTTGTQAVQRVAAAPAKAADKPREVEVNWSGVL